MSKIETKAKGLAMGDIPVQEESKSNENKKNSLDSFKAQGPSKWKALGLSATESSLDGLNDAIAPFSYGLKTAIDEGPMGSLNGFLPAGPFGLRIRKLKEDEYTEHFDKVELPPSADDASSLFPNDETGIQNSVSETCALYDDFLELCAERKETALKALNSGKIAAKDSAILKQFIGELNNAVIFTNKQKKIIKAYKG